MDPHPYRPAQHLHDAHDIANPMRWTQYCTDARPPTSQETAIWQAARKKAFPQCPKKRFKDS